MSGVVYASFYTFSIITVFIFSYGLALAQTCDLEGVSVIYVNGILTSERGAQSDARALEKLYEKEKGDDGVTFTFTHNPSRLAGFGDAIKATRQAYRAVADEYITDHDLEVMLNHLHTDVRTQKMVLVGHSQGGFYANQLYAYLIENGIPESALAVYHTGTPASFIAGEGAYTTSVTDSVINFVRTLAAAGNAEQPLEANVSFPLTEEEQAEEWAGHSFSDVYLTYGNNHIIVNIHEELIELESASVTDIENGCFDPPGRDVGHRAVSAFFSIADPAAVGVRRGFAITRKFTRAVAAAVQSPFARNDAPAGTPPVAAIDEVPADNTPPLQRPIIGEPTPFGTPNEPPRATLDDLRERLNEATALAALLESELLAFLNAREQACIAESIRGPWDHFGWYGDKPGCDDPTPKIPKMFYAPVQGIGGGRGNEQVAVRAGSVPSGTITTDPSGTTVAGHIGVVTWTSTNADSCEVSGGPAGFTTSGLSGSESTLFGFGENTFTLSCTNDSGVFTTSTTVTGPDQPEWF